MTPLQHVQYLDKYARWNEEKGRRETWPETTERVIEFFKRRFPSALDNHSNTSISWDDLRTGMLTMKALPSMRIVQMAGPALERCNVGAYNCAYLPLDSWFAFSELLYILMQGTGVGFSVESQYVEKLPTIQSSCIPTSPRTVTIEDSTQGWCNALHLGMCVWAKGDDVVFDYSQIRPFGTPLKTKGGRASGPGPLKELLEAVREKMLVKYGAKGGRLTTLDCHDIACLCGSIVQVGGVRRAAEISLSDLDDQLLRECKSGEFWATHPYRAMANNSAVYNEKPDASIFLTEWLSLVKGQTGERGLFNREGVLAQMPARRKALGHHEFGTNPCGEIILRPRQFCNLSIAVARVHDTFWELQEKVALAAVWGTLQAGLTRFAYIGRKWKENCEEERLLGVDITGIQDCALLNAYNPKRREYLSALRERAMTTNRIYSEVLGIESASAVTCVKPSGNSSQLLDCSSGLHPRYAPYYIRRLRIGQGSPIAHLLRWHGVPHHPENNQDPENPSVWVFEFPVAAPVGAPTRHSFTATAQLENWLDIKEAFTEHNPSCTIYVQDSEWPTVAAWVYAHWDAIGGLSFLPADGGIYQQAPYEEITAAAYIERVLAFPVIDFDVLANFEHTDTTELQREFQCTGDKCEL